MSREIEQYKEYRIDINAVPEDQFDFDDFGWAFQVFKDNALCFRLVIKTTGGRRTETNKIYILNWGKERIHSLLDVQGFEQGADYCYEWVDLPSSPVPEKIDCKGFLREG